MIEGQVTDLVGLHCGEDVAPDTWDLGTLDDAIFQQFNLRLGLPEMQSELERPGQVEGLVAERVKHAYEERERLFSPPVLRHLERIIYLQTLDNLWREHLLNMDHLKEGIGLRGYAQKNPLQEYQKEGYDLFEDMVRRLESDVVEKVMSVQLQVQAAPAQQPRVAAQGGGSDALMEPAPEPAATPMPAQLRDMEQRQRRPQRIQLSHGDEPVGGTGGASTVTRDGDKVGRNDPCPCGSGKKYKKCHGQA
jgi:preprotein translocase subunit SecA